MQSFKKVTGQSILVSTKEFFNTQIGRLRVKSEHCIGILKNRFPAVRRNNIRVRGKRDIKRLYWRLLWQGARFTKGNRSTTTINHCSPDFRHAADILSQVNILNYAEHSLEIPCLSKNL